MEKQTLWKEATGGLFKAVAISMIAGIVYSILSFAPAFMPSWLLMIVQLVVLLGYVLMFVNLGKLRELVNAEDAKAVGKLRTAYILQIIVYAFYVLAYLVPALWLASIVPGIIGIIAFFMLLSAYGKLGKSQQLPELARAGFGQVRTAMLIGLIGAIVGVCLAFIPFVGPIIAGIIAIIANIFTLLGWAKVAKSEI